MTKIHVTTSYFCLDFNSCSDSIFNTPPWIYSIFWLHFILYLNPSTRRHKQIDWCDFVLWFLVVIVCLWLLCTTFVSMEWWDFLVCRTSHSWYVSDFCLIIFVYDFSGDFSLWFLGPSIPRILGAMLTCVSFTWLENCCIGYRIEISIISNIKF